MKINDTGRKAGRKVAGLAAGVCASIGMCSLSACNLEMEKETGYADGNYTLTEAFSDIDLVADGGVDMNLAYGEQFSVSYTESEQEKFVFSQIGGTLRIEQRRSVGSLLNYKSKELTITVPFENKIATFNADVDGAMKLSVAEGEYGNFVFDVDGAMSLNFENVRLNRLDIACDGALTATMVGSSEYLKADCDGSADFRGRTFTAKNIEFDADGVLNFEVTCTDNLVVDSDGVCHGIYYGDPVVRAKCAVGEVKRGEDGNSTE